MGGNGIYLPSVSPTLPKQHKIEKGQLPIRLLFLFHTLFYFLFLALKPSTI